MKDEIKGILNQLEIVARKHTIEVCEDGSKIEFMPASVVDELRLNNYSAKLLLDYITNLQERNNNLKEDFKRHIDRINELTERSDNLQEELEEEKRIEQASLDTITNLQEEVKSANESITWWTNRFKAVEEENRKLKEENERLEHNTKVSTKWELKLSQENQKLKEKLRTTQEKWKKDKQWVECRTKEWLDYKSRNEKANEFIKEHTNNFAEYLDVYEAKELSNILQGEDKE